ncbi:glutaredoxin family protein [Rhodococcus sp. ABRD24]|uniref:glutaredoxin family protein n=1 Tax=Rhodococcus sp. ABRD24 TaxID=2507582 RepID=UPI00103FE15E|nr:glutaredoxin family protein [Rhodococcus sp. ABRD24]QBJ95725.1 glutaredoxin family protein [Rhodococcus sp. ABRD24]
MDQPRNRITLLTRAGCGACVPARELLEAICVEFELELTCTDVDEAAATDPDLRAEYGDRLPVVLLDGREHSYWEVDEERLRADLAVS